MPSVCNIDGVYKILVKKELLPQFLEQKYSHLIPEIYDELNKGDESYWCINFCYQKKNDDKNVE